ncbi:1-phosphofructokinase family hexose kinase [Microbacterium sp. Marseille-Q6965]|uniref:1-phosphofructokinase family hexose kinase n=1 Tax=Microbacterium sp. Marseille-Q6965 TaxID=2965072 RepID=UPI0021B77A41|nr:hexose kinase [Microbacterium sp. Marseille-Q6965]
MIVTLTMNPSLDRTVSLGEPLRPGDVQQAVAVREDGGGKGMNVARVVAAAGREATAVLPLAADDPYRALAEGAAPAALRLRIVPIDAPVRANLTLTDPAGETTKINLPGPVLDDAQARALVDAVVTAADGADWLALCGSLPRGVAPDFYVDVVDAVRARAARPPRIAVDTSGPALAHVVARCGADLIKPNEDELLDLVRALGPTADAGAPTADGDDRRLRQRLAADPPGTAAALARALVPERVRAALITLGGDGAVLVDGEGASAAAPPPTAVRSTVGAGDSALAGYLLADLAGEDAPGRLRSAIRHGSATAALPGTQLAGPADLPRGEIPVRPVG